MKPLYEINRNTMVDEFDVDHSKFSLRDEIEYNFKRANERANGTLPQNKPSINTGFTDNPAFIEANRVKQSLPSTLEVDNAIVMANKNLSPIQQIGQMAVNNYTSYNPFRRMGEVAGTLKAAKDELDNLNIIKFDNYAHRYGMYENARDGADKAIYTGGAGILREGYDFFRKIPFNLEFWKQPNKFDKLSNVVQDSYKDTLNNIDAIKSGLQNKDIDGGLWLNDFNYNTNTWKK